MLGTVLGSTQEDGLGRGYTNRESLYIVGSGDPGPK